MILNIKEALWIEQNKLLITDSGRDRREPSNCFRTYNKVDSWEVLLKSAHTFEVSNHILHMDYHIITSQLKHSLPE